MFTAQMPMLTTTPNAELERLDLYRLQRDLSYRDLAAEVGIPYRTLYTLLTAKNPRPFDRTVYKIRKFLASANRTERRAVSR